MHYCRIVFISMMAIIILQRSNGLPAITGSKSCVAVQDINADGSADIFVGGRVVPGRYPEAPKSYF